MITTTVDKIKDEYFVLVADSKTEKIGVRKFFSFAPAMRFAKICADCECDVCELCKGTGIVEKDEWVGDDTNYQVKVACKCQE